MSVKELTGALRSADKNGNKSVLYPMTKIDLVEGLRDELNSLEVSKNVSDSLLAIDDSANLPLLGLSVYGKSEQFITTGAQLWEHQVATEQTLNGVTYTYENGVYTLNGTSDRSFNFILGTVSLEDGPYTLSANNPSHNGNSEQALIQVYSMTTLRSLACLDNKTDSFGTQEMVAGTDYELRMRINVNVTYNNFIVKPMLNKGDVALPHEPYTGGTPSPNPDFPQEITNIGDAGSVDIGVYGSNLLPYPYYHSNKTVGSMTFTVNDDYSITVDGSTESSYATFTFATNMTLIDGVEYYLSYPLKIHYLDENGENKYSDNGASFIWSDKYTFVKIYIDYATNTTIDNLTVYPMLTLFRSDVYIPYIEKQTISISTPNGLPGIKVTDASLANYTDSDGNMWCCDEVDFGRGMYVKRVDKIVFNGSEDERWSCNATSTDGVYRLLASGFVNLINPPAANNVAADILCTHYVAIKADTEGTYGCHGGISVNISGGIYIYDDAFTTNDVTLWTTHLSENPITLLYILATPIETALSESELAQYTALHTNCPNTTVMNDKNAHTSMTYYTKRYNEAIDFIITKIENNRNEIQAIKGVTEVTLLANNWSGSSSPYTQTVEVAGITEDDNPTLVTAMYDSIDAEAKAAYLNAFGIIAAGDGTTNNGSVTFSVSEKTTIDIVVGLKGV